MIIEAAETVTADTKMLRLKWPDGYTPEFKIGQFITLYWPGDNRLQAGLLRCHPARWIAASTR
jgi:ferredoxin-NADP reductase